jgi:hypothetical protein
MQVEKILQGLILRKYSDGSSSSPISPPFARSDCCVDDSVMMPLTLQVCRCTTLSSLSRA